jgi:hypothetical protein
MTRTRTRLRARPRTVLRVRPREPISPDELRFAATSDVERLQPWVDRIIAAVGLGWAFISDESTMGDFFLFGGDAEQRMRAVAGELGTPFAPADRVIEVADRMRQRAAN